ncbi:AVN_HP_G0101060.mRNA.1.CDS.1 [Saccharomyces cerevisiae]|nr:AVN_HP_G0042810.mRNA.1.CDS.1 [Saccharomyces cerevisiae]CAI5113254.1 AVN_HP_G0101060.mRNA.1.CDS.1 [Saccharomyces cerevisiae]CAI6897473.1 AVN_HP_G0042810.mRNA.1.CDS.1 [Saccharomyces cerevisiae]CAI6978595.1 AVN_HP_G0101060.mRNA.1.CDS.1 [Saccharomyces cerevisiae]CAI7150127.1 AVN_collapsed_G0024020.mRNA.1.CDS.1 [Saccharomyces cerevisiae]
METIDIQNRSFVVRWVKCGRGDVINYQIKPLKKSIEVGIYKKLKSSVDDHASAVHIAPDTKTLLDYTTKSLLHKGSSSHIEEHHRRSSQHSHSSSNGPDNKRKERSYSSLSISGIQQQSQEIPLREKLSASGFTLVKRVGNVSGNTMVQGDLEVKDTDYYYAFILDNSSSKNAKKKILFNASVINGDNQSMISTRSTPPARPTALSRTSTQQDMLFRVGQGRYLQGYLLKKRRKRLQGFKKRFFTLDFRYGTLSYYLNDHNQTCRGEIVISLSSVSANKKDKIIIIDSGMEVWVLKATTKENWQSWVDALQTCFDDQFEDKDTSTLEENPDILDDDKEVINKSSPQDHDHLTPTATTKSALSHRQHTQKDMDDIYVPLPSESYATFSMNLRLIQQRLEQCKKDSLSYKPTTLHQRSEGLNGTHSSSSVFTNNRVSSFNHSSSGMTSSDSLASEEVPSNKTYIEHALYNQLADLEVFVSRFVTQGEVLFKDHQILCKKAKDTRVSLTSYLSENDEFFDAEEEISRGVIILPDTEDDINNIVEETPLLGKSDQNEFTTEVQLSGSEQIASSSVESYTTNDENHSRKHLKNRHKNRRRGHPHHQKTKSAQSSTETFTSKDLFALSYPKSVTRRNDIPEAAASPPSLLSFLRKNVGKDLSSIAMPVTSNEPISILQLISETFEYAPLLTKATQRPDPITFVSAFAISFLSIYRDKTRTLRKPFNPLLAETFELIREDMGFRLISEKVSHRPPVFAFFAEHLDWECSYTVTPSQKFWGKSIELNNEGILRLKFKTTGELFEWTQPTTILKNLIAGERYMEPVNEFEVHSSKGDKSHILFDKAGMFSGRSEGFKVSIIPPPSSNRKKETLAGKWTQSLANETTHETIWEVGDLVSNPKKKYGFTKFTANLNEITEIEKGNLPPTDSRLRPDIRAYEEGNVDKAEEWKLKLEQLQRERRNKGQDVEPKYFEKVSKNEWKYITGPKSYWERRKKHDWSDISQLW